MNEPLTIQASDQGGGGSSPDDVELSREALRQVLRDPLAPAAAKAQAARTLAEMAGALGRHAEAPKRVSGPLSSMSPAELQAELDAILQPIAAPD